MNPRISGAALSWRKHSCLPNRHSGRYPAFATRLLSEQPADPPERPRLERPGPRVTRRLFFVGLSGLAGCTRNTHPRLNVFNWSAYVASDTISNFEREFGVRVRYAIHESNEEMLAKVITGNSGWDVVFPSNYYIQPMLENNLLAPLRHEWLPNLVQLDNIYQSPVWDPKLQWCVPYMWGASGIIFNRKATGPLDSWNDMWSERFAGKMTMLDDPAEVLGVCLKKLGYSINVTDPALLERAKKEAIAQKRLLRAYLNAEVRDQVVSGDVLAAQMWATTAQQAIDVAPDLEFVYPREGYSIYTDSAVVLRESSRQRLAHEFINYLLRPNVAADVVKEARVTTVNAGARKLLPDDLRNNQTLFPNYEIVARGEWFATMPGPVQRLRDRIWTEIKSA